MNIKTYILEKDSKVTVYKIFGDQYYFAVVDLKGRYPKTGYVSQNSGRDEFVVNMSGNIEVSKNGKKVKIKERGSILLENGCKYEIEGKAKCIVFVNDGKDGNGKSEIVKKP